MSVVRVLDSLLSLLGLSNIKEQWSESVTGWVCFIVANQQVLPLKNRASGTVARAKEVRYLEITKHVKLLRERGKVQTSLVRTG